MVKVRYSGVELAKNIAILFIIVSHVANTFQTHYGVLNNSNYSAININYATTNMQQLILTAFSYLGGVGNVIFFVASAYFLCDSDKCNKKKVLQMIIDVWVVSVSILVLFIAAGHEIAIKDIVKSFFPNVFANNWYISCYILFYLIHDYINIIINSLSQRRHLIVSLIMSVMYLVVGSVKKDLFYSSHLVLFIVLYFVIAYMKKYVKIFEVDIRINSILIIIGIVGILLLIAITNYLGLNVYFFEDKLLYWAAFRNPFVIMIGIGMFNVSKKIKFHNRLINEISSLSMLIYILHENILVRQYLRPIILVNILDEYGTTNIVLIVLAIAIIVWITCIIISWGYKMTIQKINIYVADKMNVYISNGFNGIIDKMISFK